MRRLVVVELAVEIDQRGSLTAALVELLRLLCVRRTDHHSELESAESLGDLFYWRSSDPVFRYAVRP